MNLSSRFLRMPCTSLLLGAALAVPTLTSGCTVAPKQETGVAACCTEFKPGAAVNDRIGGSSLARVAAQAIADFGGVAAASIDDITTICRSMAQDLDAPRERQDAASAPTTRRDTLRLWCEAAVVASARPRQPPARGR